MSNFVVLVKQVPDVSQITQSAFDFETGTLIRAGLANVINELDTQALALANHMKQLAGGEGKIVCLSMGPVVARGLQNQDSYQRLTSTLCRTLGRRLGVQVERGVSRAAVEQGFIERAHQVGQTGTSVAPKLYLALGIVKQVG